MKEVLSSLVEWENRSPTMDCFGTAELIAVDPWRRSLCMLIWLSVVHSTEDLLELLI